jgi:hypothetical protein
MVDSAGLNGGKTFPFQDKLTDSPGLNIGLIDLI